MKLLLIAAVSLTLVVVVSFYALGGKGLLGFALSQTSWKLLLRILGGALTLFVLIWTRHVIWYRDLPPPVWWRQAAWLNIVEALILAGLVFLGFWAIPRFH